jgi:outer membrane protein assembly factor BamD
MNRRLLLCLAVVSFLLAFPERSPAPLIYSPEDGWTYEKPGTDSKWQRARAKDQLEVAQTAFGKQDYSLSLKAARRAVSRWPFSDYAPQAQYLVGRCYEEQGKDEQAFKQYQQLLEKYPKMTNAHEVLERQFIIANKFLGGQWRKLFGAIPVPPSREKTIEMYQKIIKNAPYSDVAPQAQINIGTANEKSGKYAEAMKAYEAAADRYSEREKVAADAMYKAGQAAIKQARTAEYDQSTAGKAIDTFTEFGALYPDDSRTSGTKAQIDILKSEQALGSYKVAKFYEGKHRWAAALIYYNEVLVLDPNGPKGKESRERITEIKQRIEAKPVAKPGVNVEAKPVK